jgi:hypothetical protein
MNQISRNLVPFTLFCLSAARAQQPNRSYDFRSVVDSFTKIAGRPLPYGFVFDGASLNDNGAVTFVGHWPDNKRQFETHSAVFTENRIVDWDRHGQDDKVQVFRVLGNSLQINKKNVVAYEAEIAGEGAEEGNSDIGIFVEKTLVMTLDHSRVEEWHEDDPWKRDFILTEDGKAVLTRSPYAPRFSPNSPPPDPQKKEGFLGRVHIKMPKISPVEIAPKDQAKSKSPDGTNKASVVKQPSYPTTSIAYPSAGNPLLAINSKGQVLVLVTDSISAPLLLLGTPVKP